MSAGRGVLFVSGSPSATSRSTLVAKRLAQEVEDASLSTRFISLTDFQASDVLLARASEPTIKSFLDSVRAAAALVLVTPVYKATYSGALKAIVDLIPPDELRDKPVLAIATTRLEAHGVLASSAFDALFSFFGAQRVDDTLVVLDAELEGTPPVIGPQAQGRILLASRSLLRALTGHPVGAA